MPEVSLTSNIGFVSHENSSPCFLTFSKNADDINTSVDINYTVSGTGASEVNISNGSINIPSGERLTVLQVNTINNPNSVSPDREFTVSITSDENYTISADNFKKGDVSILVKDLDVLTAFPSAYGGGCFASGGRGGNIYHVTSLLDDGSIGTFRWAVTQPRPAIVLFDVSGTILLNNSLTVSGEDLTIAGQSAPQGGITIVCPPTGNIRFQIGTFGSPFANHIWRYIRIRDQFYGGGALDLNPGYGTLPDFSTDPEDYTYGRNLIFDHLSISWAASQGFNIRGQDTNDITFQNGIIGECSRGSLFGDTGYKSSNNLTFRNNVFYQVSHRTPNSSARRSDVYNNVVYDWINRLTVAKDGSNINHFNNYYYKGTRTNISYSWNGIDDPQWYVNGVTYADINSHNSTDGNILIHSKNNVIQDFYDGSLENNDKYIWMHHAGYLPNGTEITIDEQQKIKAGDELFKETPFIYIGKTPNLFLTAEEAKTIVPNEAGANKYLNADGSFSVFRDATDNRYLNAIINDIPTSWSATGSTLQNDRHTARDSQDYADFQSSISSTPINTRPIGFYNNAKSEHIPEIWFDANVPNGETENDFAPSGYTWIEEYLNQVDVEIVNNGNVIYSLTKNQIFLGKRTKRNLILKNVI